MRIGLFGGTFDPVHTGHLRSAVELTEQFALERLHLLPNHRPVHRGTPQATTDQRINMLTLATEHLPQLVVDDREARRDKPSYTVDTLTAFREEFPDATLVFFMGVDAFSAFDSWHRWQHILSLAHLVIIDRPGFELNPWALDLIATQQEKCGGSFDVPAGVIQRCSVTQLAISATDIRRRAASGLSIDYLVPVSVKRYIVSERLYQS